MKELKLRHEGTEAMLEGAWGIIANASGGDWSKASREWQEAARRWRDSYHAYIAQFPSSVKEDEKDG